MSKLSPGEGVLHAIPACYLRRANHLHEILYSFAKSPSWLQRTKFRLLGIIFQVILFKFTFPVNSHEYIEKHFVFYVPPNSSTNLRREASFPRVPRFLSSTLGAGYRECFSGLLTFLGITTYSFPKQLYSFASV
uniref:Uncharacterized protein n=1 Tax=Molossus molossus TaxID=27622 RepID=A0A7J8GL68_MOLMO|nr:hypothetical protein HJG59_011516 [Molossus molossus]